MHYSYYKRPLLLLLIVYLFVLAFFYTPRPGKHDVSHFISSQEVTLTGKVVGFPTLKKNFHNVILQVQRVDGKKAAGKVYARFENYEPRWHETLQVTGKLKKPYSVDVYGNFDWGAYLASKHIFTEINVSRAETVSGPSWFFRGIYRIRADILQTFEQHFDRSLSAIAGGVLLGERGEMDEQLYTDFQDSGAIHLLVASGGNVGFVTLVVFAFCALFGLSRKKTVFAALVIAGIYTLIAGADAPLTRAYFMTVCAVAGYFLYRNSGVFQGLILSCLVILLFHPSALFETGFQMSFLATLAIVICLNNYELPYAWPRWVKFFVQIFMATLSTQLVLLPVFTNVFFKVSFVGLLANMVLVPLASVLMAVSFAFYVFSLLHIGFLLKSITGACLWVFKFLVESFAAQSFASVQAAAWRSGWIISYYALLFLLFNLPQKPFVKKTWKAFCLVAVLAPAVQFIFFNAPTAWLMSEWNKNSILIRMPDGTRILAGAALDSQKLARAVLKSGGRKIEAVLLSDNSAAQLKNVAELQAQMKVGQVIIPFENTWPGEEINIKDVTVSTQWGILQNRHGELWTNRGYGGKQDSVSYTLTHAKHRLTLAGNGRFVIEKETVLENEMNHTRRIKW